MTMQEVATIFVSTLVFGDKLTVVNTVGLCITLFGIGLYNWLKMRAAALKARKQVRDQELAAEHGMDFSLEQHDRQQHMYSMVAESTPILLADGGMTEYRDSIDYDDDNDRQKRTEDKTQRFSNNEQYELN